MNAKKFGATLTIMKRLENAADVVEALGGPVRIAELTSANAKAVWNWHGYFLAFPPDTYVVMMRALKRRGYTAPPHLWKMRGFEQPKKRAA